MRKNRKTYNTKDKILRISNRINSKRYKDRFNEVMAKILYSANAGLYSLEVGDASWDKNGLMDYLMCELKASGFSSYKTNQGTIAIMWSDYSY